MNEDACTVFLNIIRLSVRMMPIFVCLEPRNQSRETIAAVSAYVWVIMVSLQALLKIGQTEFLFLQGGFSCLFFLILLIFFRGNLPKKIFLYVSAWMFSLLSASLNEFFAWVLKGRVNLSYGQVGVIVSVIFAAGFFCFVRYWMKPVIERLYSQLSRRSACLLLAYPAGALVIVMIGSSTVFSKQALASRGFWDVAFYLALSAMILAMYVMILNSYMELLCRQKTEEELQFARQLIGKQREHYNQMLEHMDQVRIIRHDFRHHIYALLQMDREEQTRYLLNLQKEFDALDQTYYCENQAAGGLLKSYADACKQEQVEFQVQADISAHIPIDDLTLCIVIGNLLENALEACRRLEGGRFIHLRARWSGDRLVMVVENSYNGRISKNGERILSTKRDGGLGMMSVRRVLDRPGDDFDVCYDGSRFTAMVNIVSRV